MCLIFKFGVFFFFFFFFFFFNLSVAQCNALGNNTHKDRVTAPLACRDAFDKNSGPWLDALGDSQQQPDLVAKLDLVDKLIHAAPKPGGGELHPGYDITAAVHLSTYISGEILTTARADRWFARFFLGLAADRDTSKVWTGDGAQYVTDVTGWDGEYKASARTADAGNFDGKMIMYAGLRDGTVPTPGTRRYVAGAGPALSDRLRYFEIPGMEHCAAEHADELPWYIGPSGLNLVANGPKSVPRSLDKYDALELLAQWVDGKTTATELTAVRFKQGAFSTGGTFDVEEEYPVKNNNVAA
jgi:hypothetical protein